MATYEEFIDKLNEVDDDYAFDLIESIKAFDKAEYRCWNGK